MKLNKKSRVALAVLLGAVTMGTTAFAGTSFTSYNVSVPKINGSGYSGTQTKVTSGANASVISTSTDGFSLDVRQQKSDGNANGDWYRNLKGVMDTGYNIGGHVDQINKSSVRLHFSNDINTLQAVTVKGTWASQ